MPDNTLRWLRAIAGALTMMAFVFGVLILVFDKLPIDARFDFLKWFLPALAGQFTLMYMPQVLYAWALRCDAMEQRFLEELRVGIEEVEEVEEIDEDDDHDFSSTGCDGKPIPKNFG